MSEEKEKEHIKITIQYGESNPKLIENKSFPNNEIVTTKYNLITWAPKSLIMQFKRAANIYFLIVTVLTCLSFSPKQPGSMIGTFAFVLICTMIKEAVEDWGRYNQDKICNNRMVWKRLSGEWRQVKCWTLSPGDVIKVEKDEEFSSDTLIIKSSNDSGYGYIETKSLDGETNLKEKASLEEFRNIQEIDYEKIKGSIECEKPNENLSAWNGCIILYESAPIFCKFANIILKGCVLKNTQYVCGIVIYSGKNTKIMNNAKAARFKISKVLVTMNRLLYSVFMFDIILCATFGALSLSWTEKYDNLYTYIFKTVDTNKTILKFIVCFFTFFVAYSHMIPISLYVILEIIKIIQGLLVYYDNEMYDTSIDKPALCRATDLIEELGQVEFIFSDKTGTLTQNSMVLKKAYLNQKVYGNIKDKAPDAPFTINGDVHLENQLRSILPQNEEEKKEIKDFLYILTLCHAVFPELNKEGKLIYQGASPDDIALVKGAQQLGFEFLSKEFSEITIEDNFTNTQRKFELKAELPFDSNRKRMSVIVFEKDTGIYKLLSKGADTVMIPRIDFINEEVEETNRVIKVLSKEVLRVLVMSKKVIPENIFMDWEARYKEARMKDESEI